MSTITPQDIEQELLEIRFLQDGLKCDDWSHIGCKNEATHYIVCPCKEGRSAVCDGCLAKLRAKASKRFLGLPRQLWFYSSCKHSASLDKCAILPI